jgi:exopolyphosphatase / guanosine-5'-triphosphate,3'-diphosphate pyrophosphatase
MARRGRPPISTTKRSCAAWAKGLAETGRLNPRGRERALAALKRFALLAKGMNMAPLTVVATAAVREAWMGKSSVTRCCAKPGCGFG